MTEEPPIELSTLAQEWQEFQMHTYKNPPDTEDARLQMREYRVCFYSGFYACLSCMARVSELPDEQRLQQGGIIGGYIEEFRAFARRYLEERQGNG